MDELAEGAAEASVVVEQVYPLKTAAHPMGFVVPRDLIVTYEDQDFLKLVGSKLVCPEESKHVKNITIAATQCMKALTEAVWVAFLSPDDQEPDAKPQLFEEVKDKKKSGLKRKMREIAARPKT